ncbi:MAG: hypothetical protein JXA60_08360 [Candidatus Coatesbacteria bacterium]|nr:hypothetical protein [Candidatus Coatesbacteria bacterium]
MIEYLYTFLKSVIFHRKFIFWMGVAFFGLASAYAFWLDNSYEALVVVLPPAEETGIPSGLSSMMSSMGNIGKMMGNTSIPGFNMGGTAGDPELYLRIIQSAYIREKIVKRFNLKEVYEVDTNEEAIELLDEKIEGEATDENLIKFTVIDKDRSRAAAMANAFIEELDKFNKESLITKAKITVQFLKQRLDETKVITDSLENKFQQFQEENKAVSLPDETEALIRSIAQIKAEIISKEAQLNIVKTYATEKNPEHIALKTAIDKLKTEMKNMTGEGDPEKDTQFYVPFSKIPKVAVDFARLKRDIEIQEAVYLLIYQQYEMAKIEEKRTTPTIQVLDPATPVMKKIKPKRAFYAAGGLFFGLFMGIIVALFWDLLNNMISARDDIKIKGRELWQLFKDTY